MKKYKPQIIAMAFAWMTVIELFVGTWLRLNVITDPAYEFAFFIGGVILFTINLIVGALTAFNSDDK